MRLKVFLVTMGASIATSAIALASPLAAGSVQPRDPGIVDRAYIASTAYHLIKRYFAHAEGLPAGYDFEARYRSYLDEAMSAPDRQSFSLATMRFFASLHNGHTSFEDDSLSNGPGSIPFRISRIDGLWTVVRSRLSALAPGDTITTIDGKPADEWLQPIRDHIGESSETALDRMTWSNLFLFPKHFIIGTGGGQNVPVDLNDRTTGTGRTSAEQVKTVRRPDGVFVIRIASFEDREQQEAISAIRGAGDAKAILLDLRDNGGGRTPSLLLSAIMTKPYRGTIVATPMTIAENDAHASLDGTVPALPTMMMRYGPDTISPTSNAWGGRIAVLVNRGCASACEDFVLRFRDGERGLVLGEPTFGSTGQPYSLRFPEFGMSFRVSTKREYFPDGHKFEGVGIQPDNFIPLTREELKSRADTQLERAAQAILNR